jgi:hypothetical protein
MLAIASRVPDRFLGKLGPFPLLGILVFSFGSSHPAQLGTVSLGAAREHAFPTLLAEPYSNQQDRQVGLGLQLKGLGAGGNEPNAVLLRDAKE